MRFSTTHTSTKSGQSRFLYERGNHLGNVLTVLSDRKIAVVLGTNTTIDHFTSEILTANDYYSFGFEIKNRAVNSGTSYVYGFNGKRKDPEGLGGGGATYDYGFRIYNPELGKFLSVDPLTHAYPWFTPYQFAGNKPIAAIDLDGLEDIFITTLKDKTETMQIVYTDKHIKALLNGTTVPFKIYYNGDKKGTTQFEGPNKQNERAVFYTKGFPMNGSVCESAEKKKQTTEKVTSPLFLIPKPAPVTIPAKKEPDHDIIDNSAGGIAIWGDFLGYRTAGNDHKGNPAGMGAIVSENMDKQLDAIADKIKKEGVKEINLNFTYSKDANANYIPVEQSIKNGLDNIVNYLKGKGIGDVKINTNYSILNGTGNSNQIDVEYKKK